MEPASQGTIDELPFAGRIVAYVFLGIGLSGLLKLVAYFFVRDGLNVSLIDFACLYVGWGLLRGRQNAPGCASRLAGCMGICLSLVLIAGALVVSLSYWLDGEIPEFDFRPNPALAIAAFVGLCGFVLWAYRVLERPEVRAYCDGSVNRKVFRRFRMEQLFALMTMVAFASIGLSPSTSSQGIKTYRNTFTTVDPGGRSRTGVIYEVRDRSEEDVPLHTIIVVSADGGADSSSLEMWNGVCVLQVQGVELTLKPDAQVHLVKDGVLTEGLTGLTSEQMAGYLKSKPQEWSIEEIKAFLQDAAPTRAPAGN